MPSPYIPGQIVWLTATFTDPIEGGLFDPVEVTFKALAPNSQSVLFPTPVRDSTGNWHIEQVVDVAGVWTFRVETSGPEGASERVVTVNPTVFPGV